MAKTKTVQPDLITTDPRIEGGAVFPALMSIKFNAKERAMLRKLYTPTELKGVNGHPPMLGRRLKAKLFEKLAKASGE